MILCGMLALPPCLWADAWVIEGQRPQQWPAEVVQHAPPQVTPPAWAAAATAAKVRAFLRADHPLAEKRAVMAWWLQDHPDAGDFQRMVQCCIDDEQWDEAFSWMQRWAREEGLEVAEWESSPAGERARSQAKWPAMRQFLQACEKVWQQSDFFRIRVTVPTGYDGQETFRWVLGLHGYGSQPEDFMGEDFQRLSDAQRLAIIGVSGRRALGRAAMMWTEDADKDMAHVEKALQQVRKRVKLRDDRGIVVGFSQGGQLAAELAAAWPRKISICVSMSPGSRYPSGLRQRLASHGASLAQQRYFFSWISGEGAGPKQRIDDWWGILRERGAHCQTHVFAGKQHRWPPHYEDYFAVIWQVP
jgi:predicted esterase